MEQFDVVVVGAGPAGYVAAIRCAQLGLRTACVDDYVGKDGVFTLGGTCLNEGCIPSKALLDSSNHYANLNRELASHGISVDGCRLDVPQMIERKDDIVRSLTQGIDALFTKNGITRFKGRGSFVSPREIRVTPPAGSGEPRTINGDHIIIATGSVPRTIPHATLDRVRIVDSSDALDFDETPDRLGIIGAGVIGLELGSVWKRAGSEVVILEAMDRFLSFVDRDISQAAFKEFTSQGLDIRLGSRVLAAENTGETAAIRYTDGESEQTLEVDKLIVAVGRKPHTEGLDAEEVGVLTNESGAIHVDNHCRTSLPNVYAVGDVVRGPMLAHKGSEEGVMVAERIAGQQTELNYDTIPWVVYTHPEIAWVGSTETDLRAHARTYKIGTFPLSASARARAMNNMHGIVKVIADDASDELLGIHIFAPTASEMIAEAVVAMEFNASAEDIARITHAHPTLSEAIHEAALAVDGRPLHR